LPLLAGPRRPGQGFPKVATTCARQSGPRTTVFESTPAYPGQPCPAPSSMDEVAAEVRTLPRGRTIEDVFEQLDAIQGATGAPTRRLGRRPDGVACFNFMYRRVTEEVHRDLGRFE